MKRNHSGKDTKSVRMELKYCEHCGGLWVREGGGGVYCERCQEKVAELPIPKKKPGKITLPKRSETVVDNYGPESSGGMEFEAAGGVA
jgi:hypothetical protein